MAVYIRELLIRARVSVMVAAGVAAVLRTEVETFARPRAEVDRDEQPCDERYPNTETLAGNYYHRRYVTEHPCRCQTRPLGPRPGQTFSESSGKVGGDLEARFAADSGGVPPIPRRLGAQRAWPLLEEIAKLA